MKKRADDIVKGDTGGSVGYPASGGSLSPSRHTPRALATVQPAYIPQPVKSSVAELNLSQQYPVPAFSSNSLPAVNSAIKTNSVNSASGGGGTGGNSGSGGGTLQSGTPHPSAPLHGLHSSSRHKLHGGSTTPPSVGGGSAAQQQQFQRLKVEDALSYLDNVKMKFNNHPQVYNDFLDIMKEFKSQSIDTPGVIERVSKLFQGHPDLILGFNTFLPPGYKIEVQTNDSGFKVQVSMPSPSTSTTTTMAPVVPPIHAATVHQSNHTTVIPAPLALTAPPTATPATVVVSTSTKPLIIGNANVLTPGQSAQSNAVQPTPPQPPNGVQPSVSAATISQALTHYSNHLNAECPQAPLPVPGHTPTLNHADSTTGTPLLGSQPATQSQPVEFNHAINYVNKIKNRFQDQPEIYKKFLEILNTYQKDQKNFKEAGKQLTEAEVYSQVAKLFQNQDDLLAEFGQFLPDATSHQATAQGSKSADHPPPPRTKPSLGLKISSPFTNSNSATPSPSSISNGPKFGSGSNHCHSNSTPGQSSTTNQAPPVGLKRSPSSFPSSVGLPHLHHSSQPKKQKLSSTFRDVPIADAGKYGALSDYAFFDKVHKSLRSMDVYENFLRCLVLFNEDMISRAELLGLVSPFLSRQPDLLQWFKDYIGEKDGSCGPNSSGTPPQQGSEFGGDCHAMLSTAARQDRPPGEFAMEIDFSTCKRLGASYCAVPKDYVHPKCSGRTALCREVLNDSWVSFPSWSEESTFVTSRKTQYEEYIYRCEDERFELDVVIETNLAVIRVLETLHKKLTRMSTEELNKLKLDDCLGGTSPTINLRAIRRLYGDKAPDIMEGLKTQPFICVPMILKRLKSKDEEWRDSQKGFNKIWREQNEKFYLKSLDHQGINFKQNDLKALRSKSLFNEIETLFDERHDQAEEANEATQTGPHMTFSYKDKSVLDDANNLLIHHVKRQTSINKEDKQRIKHLLRQFIPDLFHHPRQELSEDEREELNDKMDTEPASPGKDVNGTSNISGKGKGKDDDMKDSSNEDTNVPIHALSPYSDDAYTLFFGNNKWYLFLRLHQILCERLTKIFEKATILAQEESIEREKRSPSTAMALRLKPRCNYLIDIEIEDYYPAFLDMVKNVLDGNMDANAYEDTLREMFGIHAYIAFTLDKVVSYAVRQLQHLVLDESCTECADLYTKEARRGGAGGLCSTAQSRLASEAAYQRKAEAALAEENCFKIFIYKRDCRLTIELLDTEVEGEGGRQARASQNWSFGNRFSGSGTRSRNLGLDGDERSWGKAIFLPRNARRSKKKAKNDSKLEEASQQRRNNDASKLEPYDDSECNFNLNNYRVVFAVDRENYLYKRSSLSKAKQSHPKLSQRLGEKFKRWHEQWISEHIDQMQSEKATEWLMGRGPDTIANFTQILTNNSLLKPPYRSYNRYRVKRLDDV